MVSSFAEPDNKRRQRKLHNIYLRKEKFLRATSQKLLPQNGLINYDNSRCSAIFLLDSRKKETTTPTERERKIVVAQFFCANSVHVYRKNGNCEWAVKAFNFPFVQQQLSSALCNFMSDDKVLPFLALLCLQSRVA